MEVEWTSYVVARKTMFNKEDQTFLHILKLLKRHRSLLNYYECIYSL